MKRRVTGIFATVLLAGAANYGWPGVLRVKCGTQGTVEIAPRKDGQEG